MAIWGGAKTIVFAPPQMAMGDHRGRHQMLRYLLRSLEWNGLVVSLWTSKHAPCSTTHHFDPTTPLKDTLVRTSPDVA